MIARPRAVLGSFALFSLGLSGCAATSPILADPRPVAPGSVRMQGGGAALAPIAGDTGKIMETRTLTEKPSGTHDEAVRAAIPGAAIAYAMRPGFAPVARASVGLRPDLEASIRYGGRDLGIGARYFLWEQRTAQAGAVTLSLGLDGRAILRHHPDESMLGRTNADDAKGYGGVVPLILGWQSDAGLVTAWFAALVGFDSVKARIAFPTLASDPANAPYQSLSAQRLFAATTLGIGLGFRNVRVGIELGIERDWLSISSDYGDGTARLWSLTPAFALSTTF